MKLIRDIRIWLGILFIALIVALRFSGIGKQLTLAAFQEKRLQLMLIVNAHYVWSALAYIGLYVAIVVLALPLAALTTIAGGFLFGVLPGTLLANIGATIGATIFFLLVRHSFGNTLQEVYKEKLHWLNQEMEKYGVIYLIAIHFIAVIPFFIVNLLIGMTRVPLRTFIWTTAVGITPGTLVYAFAGQQLATINSLCDIFSMPLLLAFALLAALALVPILAKKYGWWGMN